MIKMPAFFFILLIAMSSVAQADHGERKNKNQSHGERSGKHAEESYPAPYNESYASECGACHLPYPPGLLPSESWRKILTLLPGHFENDVQIEESLLEKISVHLDSYSRRNWNEGTPGGKTMGGEERIPIRITDTYLFKSEHHELGANIFGASSIGSPANCSACHPSADKGDFDEHSVNIPQE